MKVNRQTSVRERVTGLNGDGPLGARRLVRSLRPSACASPLKRGKTTALKEWAVTIAALASSEQTILLRKGGIREPSFQPASLQFMLLPNSFHSDATLLKPAASLKYAKELTRDPKAERQLDLNIHAEVTGLWTTADAEALFALDEFHIWSRNFIENRLAWRPKQPFTILELRCRRLHAAMQLKNNPDYWGCFSFVELDDVDDNFLCQKMQHQTPVLTDCQFAEKQNLLREMLGRFTVQEVKQESWNDVE